MIIDKALSFGGWPGLVLLVVVGGVVLGYWFLLVIQERYNRAFYCQIIAFPFTFYAARAFGITAYTIESDIAPFDQRLGLTTGMLLFLTLVLLLQKRLKRPNNRVGRNLEYLMWGYCITITLSQFVNLSPVSALLLSIGAAWQYLALFYLLISLIRNQEDFLGILNAIFLMSLLNIIVRVVAKGESLIIDPGSSIAGGFENLATYGWEVGRVGSGALGPFGSYAGYLAILITLGFGVYWLTGKKLYLLYIAIECMELLNTYTRGGILILSLLGLLLFFGKTRSMTLKIGFVGSLLSLLLSPLIWSYLSVRGFSANITEIANFVLRIELISQFYEQYSVDLWGNGIFKDTMIVLEPWLIVPVHNAYLAILDTCGPLPFMLFIVISIYSIFCSFRLYQVGVRNMTGKYSFLLFSPFLFVALLEWAVYANMSGGSVLSYFPYEATALFWIVVFLPFAFENIRRTTTVSITSQVHRKFGKQGALLGVPTQ